MANLPVSILLKYWELAFMDADTSFLVEENDGSSTFLFGIKRAAGKPNFITTNMPRVSQGGVRKIGEQVLSFRTELDMIDEYRVTGNMN
jgi:hypothetical protein